MVKTINLTANTEQAVEVTGGVHGRFENMGDGTVYVSKTANVTAGGDGVIAVAEKSTKYIKNVAAYGEHDGEYGYKGTVYLKSSEDSIVEIESGDYFFKSVNSSKGGAVSGKFVKIKGRVGTVDDLPLIADEGDLYFVGAELDEDSDEYVYTAEGQWELIGNTEVDLSGYVKTSDMADVYGIEKTTVPTIESKANENRVTLGYSAKNLLNVDNFGVKEHNGATYSSVGNDALQITTSSSGTVRENSYVDVYNSPSSLPNGIKNGDIVTVSLAGAIKSKLTAYFYISGSWIEQNTTTFSIPTNATGMICRISIAEKGTIVDEIVYPALRRASVDERLNEVENVADRVVVYLQRRRGSLNTYNFDIERIKAFRNYLFFGGDKNTLRLFKVFIDDTDNSQDCKIVDINNTAVSDITAHYENGVLTLTKTGTPLYGGITMIG